MDHNQQHPQQFGQDGLPLPHAQPAAPSPWPGQQRPLQGFSADVRAHDPRQPQAPAQPHAQFMYAPPQHGGYPQQQIGGYAAPQQQGGHATPQQGGFVQPGQPRQMSQLGVFDGVIGQAQPFGHGAAPQSHAGFAGPAHPPAPQHAAPHQQQYAFATPHGMQVVSTDGSAAHAMHYGQQLQHAQQVQYAQPQHAQQHPHASAVMAQAPAVPARRSRMRWEVIVPLAAVFCLLVAIGVFAINFDEITGRGGDAKSASSTSAKQVGGGTTTMDPDAGGTGDPAAAEADARRLMRLGHYEEAKAALAPLLAAGSPSPEVVQLGKMIDARRVRNDALLARLGVQRSAGRYDKALATLAAIERLHPLSPAMKKMRAQLQSKQRGTARASMADEAFTTATRQLAAGRYSMALATVDTALETVPGHRRLKQLRTHIVAERAAARAARQGSGGGGGGTRGGGGGAPGAGGDTGSGGSTPSPPKSNPTNPGGMPPVPDVPNVGGGGGVSGTQPGTTGHAGHAM